MPKRICSQCKTELGIHNHYFCSSCGMVLDRNLISPWSITRTRLFNVSQAAIGKGALSFLGGEFKNNLSHLLSEKRVLYGLTGFLVIILIVLGVMVFSTTRSGIPDTEPVQTTPSADIVPLDSNVINMSLNFKSAAFGANNITKFVPANVDFYAEFQDYGKFIDLVLEQKVAYKELLERSQPLIDDHFAVFSISIEGEREWGAILTPIDPATIGDELETVDEDKIFLRIIEDRLVVVTDESLLDKVDASAQGLALSLNYDPNYVITIPKTPRQGQVRMVFLRSDSKGEIFEIIKRIGHSKLSGFVEQVTDSGYNELVIQK